MELGTLSAGRLRSDASYYGPSYMIDDLYSDVGGGAETEIVLINCHYPIDESSLLLQYGATVRRLPGMTDEEAAEAARLTADGATVGFEQDATPPLGTLDTSDPESVYRHASVYSAFTSGHNVTGMPAMSVPFGHDTHGLPLGVQFAPPLGGEGVLLALAAQRRRRHPGTARPPTHPRPVAVG